MIAAIHAPAPALTATHLTATHLTATHLTATHLTATATVRNVVTHALSAVMAIVTMEAKGIALTAARVRLPLLRHLTAMHLTATALTVILLRYVPMGIHANVPLGHHARIL